MSDTTVEALAPLLLANPRGLLLARDELAGWFGSFDRYSGGKGGGDASHWLSIYNGESIIVDRKTGQPRTIYVPKASVSITGTIQPATFQRALGVEHRESGLGARLLLAYPPDRPKRWTEANVDQVVEEQNEQLLDRLRELQPSQDDDGSPCPVIVGLAPEAKRVWVKFFSVGGSDRTSGTMRPLRLTGIVGDHRRDLAVPPLRSSNQVGAGGSDGEPTTAKCQEGDRVNYIVTLAPLDDDSDPDGIRRLRRALKYALRVCKLKCVSALPDVDRRYCNQGRLADTISEAGPGSRPEPAPPISKPE